MDPENRKAREHGHSKSLINFIGSGGALCVNPAP
jgi:hypothetical protein